MTPQRSICRDGVLLKVFIPQPLQEDRQNTAVQFLLTFALRSRASELACLLHFLLCPELDRKGLITTVSEEMLAELKSCINLYLPQGIFPLLGFNPAGLFLDFRRPAHCHYIASYDPEICNKPTKRAFCAAHNNETWWYRDRNHLSRLATMMQFYNDLHNFYTYGKEDLDRLVKNFWENFKSWYQDSQTSQLQLAMSNLAIKHESHLQDLGFKGLKNLYYQKTLLCHPDRGGDQEQFILLRQSYLHLKRYLELAI